MGQKRFLCRLPTYYTYLNFNVRVICVLGAKEVFQCVEELVIHVRTCKPVRDVLIFGSKYYIVTYKYCTFFGVKLQLFFH